MRFHATYGPQAHSLLYCRRCRRTFAERRWTPFFRLQITPVRLLEVLRLLADGKSIRKVAGAVGIDKNTVLNILNLGCQHARWFQAALARDFGWDAMACDRMYEFLRSRGRERALRRRAERAPPALLRRQSAIELSRESRPIRSRTAEPLVARSG